MLFGVQNELDEDVLVLEIVLQADSKFAEEEVFDLLSLLVRIPVVELLFELLFEGLLEELTERAQEVLEQGIDLDPLLAGLAIDVTLALSRLIVNRGA